MLASILTWDVKCQISWARPRLHDCLGEVNVFSLVKSSQVEHKYKSNIPLCIPLYTVAFQSTTWFMMNLAKRPEARLQCARRLPDSHGSLSPWASFQENASWSIVSESNECQGVQLQRLTWCNPCLEGVVRKLISSHQEFLSVGTCVHASNFHLFSLVYVKPKPR